jgi:hypothetical protein
VRERKQNEGERERKRGKRARKRSLKRTIDGAKYPVQKLVKKAIPMLYPCLKQIW